MVNNGGSRVFHGVMVVPCAILCLVAVISFGSFADIHNKIRNKIQDERGHNVDYCILFTNPAYNKTLVLGDDGPCVTSIWGGVCVCLASIVIGVAFVLKAVIGVPA